MVIRDIFSCGDLSNAQRSRVTGKEWLARDCLAALSYFSNLKKMNGGEWQGRGRRGSEKPIKKVKEGKEVSKQGINQITLTFTVLVFSA